MNKYISRGVIAHRYINPCYSKLSRVPIQRDGVMSFTIQYNEYDCKENVYSNEFSVGNLIAIGAFDGQKYVSMSIGNDMNFVDNFAKSYQSVTHVQEVN